MTYSSDFEKFLHTTLSAQALNRLLNEELPTRLGSPHRRTKVIKSPNRAKYAELLHFEELLGIDAYELMQEHGLGTDGLTIIEKRDLKERHDLRRMRAAV